MAEGEKKRIRSLGLHRYLNGVTVTGLVITIIGSWTAGAEPGEVAWRGLIVVFALSFISGVIIRTWNKWDELSGEANAQSQQKSSE